MNQIPLSQIVSPAAFAAAVEAFRAALEKHNLGKPGIHAPIAPSCLIDGLVRRVPQEGPVASRGPDRFVVEPYEIIDDTPPKPPAPPAPTLEERKQLLNMQMLQAAQAAKNALLSPARARLLSFDATAAMAKNEDARTPAEHASIEAMNAFASCCADIDRLAVHAAVEIEDLTISTIDGWNPPTF